MKYTPMNPTTYQLPDPTWEWVSKEWMVDMTEDVDEAGWQYSVKFHGAVWHGNYKHFRSFVRRRRWIRLRHRGQQQQRDHSGESKNQASDLVKTRQLVKIDDDDDNANQQQQQLAESSNSMNEKDLLNKLKNCRLDRERRSVFDSLLSSSTHTQIDSLLADEEKLKSYMGTFDYEDSKRLLLQKLLDLKHNNGELKPIPLSSLSSVEKHAIQILSFYSDIYTILRL
ncbi:unnamed protein product [Absidia cylindrospora]